MVIGTKILTVHVLSKRENKVDNLIYKESEFKFVLFLLLVSPSPGNIWEEYQIPKGARGVEMNGCTEVIYMETCPCPSHISSADLTRWPSLPSLSRCTWG